MLISTYSLAIPRKIITKLENTQIPFRYSLSTFLSALILRNFIESFSQKSINYFNLPPLNLMIDLLHYDLSFISIALSLIVLFHIVTRASIEKIARVILPCFIIILLAPIIDLISTGGQGQDIRYIDQTATIHPLILFFTYYRGYPGFTLGMKIEIALILYAIACYFYLKGRSLFASLFYALMVHAIFFIYVTSPILARSVYTQLGETFQFSSSIMCRLFLLLILAQGIILAYFTRKNSILVRS